VHSIHGRDADRSPIHEVTSAHDRRSLPRHTHASAIARRDLRTSGRYPLSGHLPHRQPVVTAPERHANYPMAAARATEARRLLRCKGHHRVIEALPHIMREIPQAHLLILGSGP